MSPRVWLPVALLGLIAGGGVAMLSGQFASDEVEAGDSAALSDSSAQITFASDVEEEPSGKADSSASGEVGSELPDTEQQLVEVDRSLPAFSLSALEGPVWTAESLKGKPWVINFWATWCPPCIEEIPSMNAAYQVLEPQGIGMLAINAGEGGEAVEEFLQKIAIDFPNVLGDVNTLSNWSVKALPTTIVVDAAGNVIYEALGPRDWDDEALLQRVADLL